MFSGLTTLLFGSAQQQEPIDQKPSETSPKSKSQRKLKTKEDDDGWIVVSDKKKREKRTSNNVEETVAEEHTDNVLNDSDEDWEINMSTSIESNPNPTPEEAASEAASSSPTPPVSCPTPSTPSSLTQLDPDGSWYLTPPPCFTAGSGNSTFVSPMENLLIEHPSMSVYQWDEPSNDELATLMKPTPEEEPIVVKPTAACTNNEAEPPPKKPDVARRREHLRRASSITSRTGLFFAQIVTSEAEDKQLQLKHQMYESSKNFRRNQLERNNKVREFNGIGKRMRRKDKMKNPSGMNNNRKC